MASLRNYCAHHARIWNRNYLVTPDIPVNLPQTWLTNTKVPFNKLYAQLCCIVYLLNSIEPQNTFTVDLKVLLELSRYIFHTEFKGQNRELTQIINRVNSIGKSS